MNMGYVYLIAGFSVLMLVNGCASIVSGTDQLVTFNSEPDDAAVVVAGRVIGNTPLSVKVSRVTNQTLSFEKAGYKTYSTPFTTTTNGWFWGNIMFGGLPGSTTDSASGAMYQYSPDNYFTTLTPEGSFGTATTRPRQIREMVIAFGGEIRTGLAAGRGEELDALLVIMDVAPVDKPAAIHSLKQLAIRNYDDLDFAQGIIDDFGVK